MEASFPPLKKWVVLYFRDDCTFDVVHSKTLNIGVGVRYEVDDYTGNVSRVKLNYPQGCFWGDVIAQSGKNHNKNFVSMILPCVSGHRYGMAGL